MNATEQLLTADPETALVEARPLPLVALEDPGLEFAYRYWRKKAGDGFAPARRDILPEEIVPILAFTTLVDVIDDCEDFRYRLWGSGSRDFLDMDLTNRSVRALSPPAYSDLVFGHYTEVVRSAEPVAHIIRVETPRRLLLYGRVAMPLSDDGVRVTRLMAVGTTHAARHRLIERLKTL